MSKAAFESWLLWEHTGPVTCPHCHGAGVIIRFPSEPCPNCNGRGGWRDVLVPLPQRTGEAERSGVREQLAALSPAEYARLHLGEPSE